MTPSVAPVLVVGGGPTGLVAALTLLRNNIPVRIIDKESHYRIGQRANGVWVSHNEKGTHDRPRSFEILHFLQVHEVDQRSKIVYPAREYKHGALGPIKTFKLFAHNDPTPSIPYNNPKFLGQPVVESILRSHLNKYGLYVELGTELQSFEDNGECVVAKLVKREDGEETFETFEASYVIGADGAKGVTRRRLGLSFLGETRDDFDSVVGDLCLENEVIDRKHVHFFGERPSNFLSFIPVDEIGPGGFQFMASVKQYKAKQLIADEKLLFKCMSEIIGQEIRVKKVVFLSDFRPNIRMVDKFGVGRVFVAGDAAHVHSPTGGQGLNTSIQDAFNLAWKLSLVYKGLSPVSLLDSYTTERLPVVAEMLNITTSVFKRVLESSTFEGAVAREKRMNMLGINYRTSPIVLDEFTEVAPVSPYGVLEEGVLVAGDRGPDAPGLVVVNGGSETRLFDVFGPTHHTVLVFTSDVPSSADVLEALKRYTGDVIRSLVVLPQGSDVTTADVVQASVVVDCDGHAYRAYLAEKGEKRVVIVRPDGVVGAIVHGVEGMEAYFPQVLI